MLSGLRNFVLAPSAIKSKGSSAPDIVSPSPKLIKPLILQSLTQMKLSPRKQSRYLSCPSEVISAPQPPMPMMNINSKFSKKVLITISPITFINNFILLRPFVTIGKIWCQTHGRLCLPLEPGILTSCVLWTPLAHQQGLWTLLRIMFLNA